MSPEFIRPARLDLVGLDQLIYDVASVEGEFLNLSNRKGAFAQYNLQSLNEDLYSYAAPGTGSGRLSGRSGATKQSIVLSDGTVRYVTVTTTKAVVSGGGAPASGELYFLEAAPAERIQAVLHDHARGPAYYGKTFFVWQDRVFTDLISYAPGMSSSAADVRAVLEAEALPRAGLRRGTIDPAARERIEAARTNAWRALNLKDDTGADFTFRFDGQGRYTYERKVGLGLIERVVCDGSTILHLYPEIGIGARRQVSRFHRAEIADMLGDLMLPADDLNYGCDVKLIHADTVALVPLQPVNADESRQSKGWFETHLVFQGDRLIQRKLIEMPAKKELVREVFDADGTVRTLDGAGKELGKYARVIQPGAAPDLRPDVDSLVVLPLPLRSRHVIYDKYDLDPNQGLFHDRNCCFEHLAPEAALELLTAEFAENRGSQVDDIWYHCFAKHGDKRLGFFTLLVSSGYQPDSRTVFNDRLKQMIDAQKLTPLMRYLSLAFEPKALAWQRQFGLLPGSAPANDFLSNLLVFRALTVRWNAQAVHDGVFGSRAVERERALAFVRQHADNVWGWSTLAMLAEKATTEEFHRQIADAWGVLAEKSGLPYKARYEQAANLLRGGKVVEAREKFRKLFDETFGKGVLPPIDNRFREAFDASSWPAIMHQAAGKLLPKHRPLVVSLAWQCRQLGDQSLADELLAIALKDPANEADRVRTALAAIEYLMAHQESEQADRLVRELLEMPKLHQQPAIQRLAAKIAERRDNRVWQFTCLEKALDLEFAKMPEVFSIEPIRQDYGNLLSHYEWLAEASRNLKVDPPTDLPARIVCAADRWRSLDPDATAACDRAAKVLRMIGGAEEKSLAWEFMTTPLALRPNESDPWLALAGMLTREGNLAMADQCYEAAFAAEPTNAQILWDRGMLLERRGEIAASLDVMKQIATGDWQPRFDGLKVQARQKFQGK